MAVCALVLSSSGCKPPYELVAQEAEFARELAELKDLEAHADERRAELATLQQELDDAKVDLPAIRALAGSTATVDDDIVKITIRLPAATPESGRDVYKALFEKQPQLRVLSFGVYEGNVILEAATAVTSPAPPHYVTPMVRVPSFCSRACKDLAALAAKERDEIDVLRSKLGPLTRLTDVRETVDQSRAIAKASPPTAPSLALLDRLVLTQWLTPTRSVSFMTAGSQAQLLIDPMPTVGSSASKLNIAECNMRFTGLAECKELVGLLEITELAAPSK